MTFSITKTPIIELPAGQIFYRIQLTKARKDSVKINRMFLPPSGIKAGRFCLQNEVTAYLADSAETALYEAVFRRELKISVALSDLRLKSMVSFSIDKSLKLVDTRGFEEQYPFLQSQRIQFTQAFAEQCFAAGHDGIVFASAQHPRHGCLCLFGSGAKKLQLVNSVPLVRPGTDLLLQSVVTAARRSAVEVV